MVAELALRLDHLFVMLSRQGNYRIQTPSATECEGPLYLRRDGIQIQLVLWKIVVWGMCSGEKERWVSAACLHCKESQACAASSNQRSLFLEAHFASLFRMLPICVARQKRLEKDRLRHLTLRIMPF
jgi:hypothetical protein